MKQYIEISPEEKLALLKTLLGWNSLDQSKWCTGCRTQFTGHSVRVYTDERPGLGLQCGTPGCEGSALYWFDYPLWDKNHPETKAMNEALFKFIAESRARKAKAK